MHNFHSTLARVHQPFHRTLISRSAKEVFDCGVMMVCSAVELRFKLGLPVVDPFTVVLDDDDDDTELCYFAVTDQHHSF